MEEDVKFLYDLKKDFKLRKQNYDYVKSKKHFRHLPIPFLLHKNFIESTRRALENDIIKVRGYLSASILSINNKIINNIERDFNLNFRFGYHIYELNSSLNGIPTYSYIISSVEMEQPKMNMPYNFILMKVGNYKNKIFYYLKDFEPSFVEISESEFPKLDQDDMIKSLIEVCPSLSNSKYDSHTLNAIIANYIGSDVLKNNVDGIGASYIGDKETVVGLNLIHNCLSNPLIGIPIQHFGILNFLKKPIQEIEDIRRNKNSLGIFRTISWNLHSFNNLSNLQDSEFKYSIDNGPLNVVNIRNLENNQDFIQSLILYNNLRNRVPSDKLYGNIIVDISKEISKYEDRGNKNHLFQVLSLEKLPLQVKRLISYNMAYNYSEKEIYNNIKDMLEIHCTKIVGELIKNKMVMYVPSTSVEMKEIELKPEDITSIFLSDRTEESIIQNFMERLGLIEKTAKERLNELHESGILFKPDGIHYYFAYSESRFK